MRWVKVMSKEEEKRGGWKKKWGRNSIGKGRGIEEGEMCAEKSRGVV